MLNFYYREARVINIGRFFGHYGLVARARSVLGGLHYEYSLVGAVD